MRFRMNCGVEDGVEIRFRYADSRGGADLLHLSQEEEKRENDMEQSRYIHTYISYHTYLRTASTCGLV